MLKDCLISSEQASQLQTSNKLHKNCTQRNQFLSIATLIIRSKVLP
jgi:hypothetical protein